MGTRLVCFRGFEGSLNSGPCDGCFEDGQAPVFLSALLPRLCQVVLAFADEARGLLWAASASGSFLCCSSGLPVEKKVLENLVLTFLQKSNNT